MAQPTAPTDNVAYYPLTHCDNMSEGSSMVKAWIVEGLLDTDKVAAALDRIMVKWPMLAGRIEVTGRRRFRIRIPLGPLPEGYKGYGFSTAVSSVPLSAYVPLPLPSFSEFPPQSLFTPPDRVKIGDFKSYQKMDAPLTHWHITRFEQPGEEYSCIGIHYSHGLCDGVGFSMIMHALEAELAGKEWTAPSPPHPGINENRFQTLIEEEVENAAPRTEPYLNFTLVGFWGVFLFLWRSFREKLLYGVGSYNVLIPYAVHTKLTAHTRKTLESAGLTDAKVSSGDVITSWVLQAMYTDGTNPNKVVGMNNVASLRSEWNGELALYPHNCISFLPYPTFTCKELNTLPLHELSYRLAKARSGSRIDDAVAAWKAFQEADKYKFAYAFPEHAKAEDHVKMSNVSIARVADLDWTGAGAKRVVCHYKIFATPIPMVNILGINGRLDNGDLVLNLELNKIKAKRVEVELKKLIEQFQ